MEEFKLLKKSKIVNVIYITLLFLICIFGFFHLKTDNYVIYATLFSATLILLLFILLDYKIIISNGAVFFGTFFFRRKLASFEELKEIRIDKKGYVTLIRKNNEKKHIRKDLEKHEKFLARISKIKSEYNL